MNKLLLALLIIFVSNSALATKYYVGVAKTNITPKKSIRSDVCMGGYGGPFEKCGLTKVNDRLTSRTFAISDRDSTMILSSLDVPGISKPLIGQIKATVYERLGVPPENVFISATHTHSGSDIQGVWGGSSTEYQSYVVNKVTRSIRRALRNQEPAKIFVANAISDVENRRGWDVVDSSVSILDFISKHSNERLGTLVNMAAHPTIIPAENQKYSSDYVHYLRESVEDELGGITIFVNGAVGDAQASTGNQRGFEVAEYYGSSVGQRVVDALEHRDRVKGDFAIRTSSFTHPVTNPLILGGIQAGLIDLQLTDDNIITTQVSYFCFGDMVQGVTFPGEALTRLALPIKQSLNSENTFFFGLTNDSLGYFLPSDEFLQIEGRTTEEQASIDPFVGDKAKTVLMNLIQQ